MTLEASRLMVLAMTPPQPSSSALPMTFAFVPGGPEPMMKGFGSFRPFTVVASVGISPPGQNQLSTNLHESAQINSILIRVDSYDSWPLPLSDSDAPSSTQS